MTSPLKLATVPQKSVAIKADNNWSVGVLEYWIDDYDFGYSLYFIKS
jgi:hypothetical protein